MVYDYNLAANKNRNCLLTDYMNRHLPYPLGHHAAWQHNTSSIITNTCIVTLLQVIIDMTIVLCASNGEGQARRCGAGDVNVDDN